MTNRFTPRSRAALASLAALAVAGALWFLAGNRGHSPANDSPGLYLVAPDGPIQVRIGLRSRLVNSVTTIAAGKTVSLGKGIRALALYSDGHQANLSGPLRLVLPAINSTEINFLSSPLIQILDTPASVVTEGSTLPTVEPLKAVLHVTSPSGVTRFLNPIITWDSQGDTRYDVAVLDLGDPQAPSRVLSGMRSPVALASLQTTQAYQLEPDRIYGVFIRQSNDPRIVGTSRFLTSPTATVSDLATKPADLLAEAFSAVVAKPARTGDAWLALSHLPPVWQQSELAIRLRMSVAAQLGWPDLFARAQTDAKVLAQR
jgi:hypothetical protein